MYITPTQTHPQTTFGANIVRNPFIEAAFKRANELAKEGSEEGLIKVNKFVNNIRKLKEDKTIQSIDIDAYPEDISHFYFPGFHTVKYTEGDKVIKLEQTMEDLASNNYGDAAMEAIDRFVSSRNNSAKVEQPLKELNCLIDARLEYDRYKTVASKKLSRMVNSLNLQI